MIKHDCDARSALNSCIEPKAHAVMALAIHYFSSTLVEVEVWWKYLLETLPIRLLLRRVCTHFHSVSKLVPQYVADIWAQTGCKAPSTIVKLSMSTPRHMCDGCYDQHLCLFEAFSVRLLLRRIRAHFQSVNEMVPLYVADDQARLRCKERSELLQ